MCKLEWNTKELDNTSNFLDLTLWIDKSSNQLHYKTYQKPMNLFLYIPCHSASPPGLLKSLINGLTSMYKRQNSRREDFRDNMKKLYKRLRARGYTSKQLTPLFKEVAEKLDDKRKRNRKK